MESYKEPHPTQIWLVNAFFRLHRRREYSEVGPKAIPYDDVFALSDRILGLTPKIREIFIEVIEETDSEVMQFLYKRNADKLSEDTDKPKSKK